MIRPELTFTVGETEIRWTYGLQLDLQRLMPDSDTVIMSLMTDAFTRDYTLRRVLSPIKKSVTDVSELAPIEEIDLDPDQVLDVLKWVSAHMLYFFVTSANNLVAVGAEFKESLPSKLSTSGSQD